MLRYILSFIGYTDDVPVCDKGEFIVIDDPAFEKGTEKEKKCEKTRSVMTTVTNNQLLHAHIPAQMQYCTNSRKRKNRYAPPPVQVYDKYINARVAYPIRKYNIVQPTYQRATVQYNQF